MDWQDDDDEEDGNAEGLGAEPSPQSYTPPQAYTEPKQ
jgi:hypothetical protein